MFRTERTRCTSLNVLVQRDSIVVALAEFAVDAVPILGVFIIRESVILQTFAILLLLLGGTIVIAPTTTDWPT